MDEKFIGPWDAMRYSGKGMAGLYRLALQGKIRHHIDQKGTVWLHKDDLEVLKPGYVRRRGCPNREPAGKGA